MAILQDKVTDAFALFFADFFLLDSNLFRRCFGYAFLAGAPAIDGKLGCQCAQKHAQGNLQDEFHGFLPSWVKFIPSYLEVKKAAESNQRLNHPVLLYRW